MTLLLGIDFETTGVNPEADDIIEIGAVLMHCDITTWTLVESFSDLVKPNKAAIQNAEIHGISENLARRYGWRSINAVFESIDEWRVTPDYIVAHNAPFEQSFLKAAGIDLGKPWIDTMTDIPYPPGKGKGTLTHIAADHGILNPFPHRALPDVLTMFQVLSQYDLADVIKRASAVKVKLKAVCTFEQKDIAKSLGYRWDQAERAWWRDVPEYEVDAERGRADEAGIGLVICP